MKSEIKYNASREIKQLIAQWQSWLLNERRYSPHTLDAYSRDLSGFLTSRLNIWARFRRLPTWQN